MWVGYNNYGKSQTETDKVCVCVCLCVCVCVRVRVLCYVVICNFVCQRPHHAEPTTAPVNLVLCYERI